MKVTRISALATGSLLIGGVALAALSPDVGKSVGSVFMPAGDSASSTSSSSAQDAGVSEPLSLTAASSFTGTGCQSRSSSYPWGTGQMRSWTPRDTSRAAGTPGVSTDAGIRTGAPFTARLVQAFGRDTAGSRRTAVLEFADGCRRQYQVASFVANDVSYVDSQIAAHPLPADTNVYATSVTEENLVTPAQISNGEVRTYETQHFNIMYGTKTGNFSYRHQASLGVPWNTFLTEAGKTFEHVWQTSRAVLGAPMPYANSSVRKKINVYICGTGMPFIANGDDDGCGATAAAAVFTDATSLQPGSSTIAHEFGHTVQFYTGGFRDRDSAGPIWETNAEWNSFMQSPSGDIFVIYYLSNLENGPLWSNNRYGAFPFKSYLFEQDATKPFLWSTWTQNLRSATGASLEDWTQALVRQAQAAGVYPSGYTSFADDMGIYGARLAAMDFLHQQSLNDIKNSGLVATLYTPLRRSSTAGNYVSAPERPLRQWGTHLIPLTPQSGTVSVRVTGGTRTGSAAWRTALVSVAADGTPRYSTLGKLAGTGSATVTLTSNPAEKMYLSVTATPYAYQSLGWQPVGGAVVGNSFPYSVRITGAGALDSSATVCTSVVPNETGSNFNYNINGRIDGGPPCP